MATSQKGKTQTKTSKTTSGKGSGNFKDNPERAAEAGRKGGANSHGRKS
jgi:general stress protein YciG